MQALKAIPKVLDNIDDIHKLSSPETILTEYKKSVKIFIDAMTAEVLLLIDKYQKKIKDLAAENKRLNSKRQPFIETNFGSPIGLSPKNNQFERTGIPKTDFKNLDLMQTAKSNLFNPSAAGILDEGNRFSSVLAKYQNCDDNNFPLELINPEPGSEDHIKSRFEVKSNRKKQREEQLRHFLQTGKKNLKQTTDRFLSAIGREPQVVLDQNLHRDNHHKDHSGDSSQSGKIANESSLNKSLGDICESLNNSFVSRKARSQNKKKRDQVQEEIKMKQKRDEEITKMLKDKVVKNLLEKLRDNVQKSGKNPPEVIKNSKLISCGKGASVDKATRSQNVELPSPGKRSSKVLINPVPVDIGSKSKLLKKDSVSSPLSPGKKPQSILKQSSMVLGQSLQGISAIDFNT